MRAPCKDRTPDTVIVAGIGDSSRKECTPQATATGSYQNETFLVSDAALNTS